LFAPPTADHWHQEDEAKFVQHPVDIMYGYEELIIGEEILFNTNHRTHSQ
jgi:hypothetical protein